MFEPDQLLAECASFQAFINCYFHEVDSGVDVLSMHWCEKSGVTDVNGKYIRLISIQNSNLDYAFDMDYISLVGCAKVSAVYCRLFQHDGSKSWVKVNFWMAQVALIHDLYQRRNIMNDEQLEKNFFELMLRVTDSLLNMESYIQYWRKKEIEPRALNTFIKSEQSIVFGHWQHPTPKSKQGCLGWQQKHYSPEMEGRFQLHVYAVKKKYIKQDSAIDMSASHIIHDIYACLCDRIEDDEQLIPVHPLQADWMQSQGIHQKMIDDGLIRSLGKQGPFFSATSSMRTVYNEELDWMLKLSIPVKLTNSLRVNKINELYAGALMSRLIYKLGIHKAFNNFSFIDDPAWLTVNIGEEKESGFECIVRENKFKTNNQVYSIAYLTQNTLNSRKYPSKLTELVCQISNNKKISRSEAALEWFGSYWSCMVKPCIQIFDQYGIALEAHQQNILLDIDDGLPTHCHYRDNQGFYLSKSRKVYLLNCLPGLAKADDLFYDDNMIIRRFGYYLFINQVFSVVHRLAYDNLVAEDVLLRMLINLLRSSMSSMGDLGGTFIQYIMSNKTLSRKANLLTRIDDIDELEADLELAVYVDCINPIANFINQQIQVPMKEYA